MRAVYSVTVESMMQSERGRSTSRENSRRTPWRTSAKAAAHLRRVERRAVVEREVQKRQRGVRDGIVHRRESP